MAGHATGFRFGFWESGSAHLSSRASRLLRQPGKRERASNDEGAVARCVQRQWAALMCSGRRVRRQQLWRRREEGLEVQNS